MLTLIAYRVIGRTQIQRYVSELILFPLPDSTKHGILTLMNDTMVTKLLVSSENQVMACIIARVGTIDSLNSCPIEEPISHRSGNCLQFIIKHKLKKLIIKLFGNFDLTFKFMKQIPWFQLQGNYQKTKCSETRSDSAQNTNL